MGLAVVYIESRDVGKCSTLSSTNSRRIKGFRVILCNVIGLELCDQV